MPSRWKTFPIECREGLVTNLPPIQQGMKLPGSARRLVNFEPSVQGGYRRINGYLKFDSDPVPATFSSSPILGVGFLDGDAIAVREDSIYSSSGGGWASIATGRTHAGKHRFNIFNFSGVRKVMGTDGTDFPYTWDGTTFVEITGSADVDGASFATEFKDHMFYAKGSLVTFSVPFDETDFTVADGAGSFRMPNEVTGMIVFRQRLFIFTETEIKVLDGSSVLDFQLTSVTNDVGCVEPDTIQEVGTDVAFMGPDGIRLLGATDRIGDFSNAVASKVIQTDVKTFRNFYSSFSSVTIREKSQYRVIGFLSGRDSISTDGFIATQIDPQNSVEGFAWGATRGIKAFSAGSWVYQGNEVILFVDETEYVYQMDVGSTFDGAEITADYWTPYISFEDPTYRKTLYKANMYFSPEGDITGELSLNFDQDNAHKIQPEFIPFSASGGGVLWDDFIWGESSWADAPDANIDKQLVGAGFNASFQFSFSGGDPFIFDTIMVEYSIEGRN